MYRLTVIAILAAALAACSGTTVSPSPIPSTPAVPVPTETAALELSQRATPTPAATVRPTLAPKAAALPTALAAPAAADARGKVEQGLRFLSALHSYRARLTIVNNGSVITRTLEAIPPDRFHLVTFGQGYTNESIIVGQSVFARQGSGTWSRFNAASDLLTLDPTSALQGTGTFTRVGVETLDGLALELYQAPVNLPTPGATAVQRFWIGSDGAVHQAETRMSMPVNGKIVESRTTTLMYDFDDSAITIEPPLP